MRRLIQVYASAKKLAVSTVYRAFHKLGKASPLLILLVLQSRDRKGVGSVVLQLLSPAASQVLHRLRDGGPKPNVKSN